MSATVQWSAAPGEFELLLCHGDDCRDRIVTWNGVDSRCEGDIIETGGSSACVEPAEGGLRFDAFWVFDEGAPSEKTFRIRIIDRTSGAVMLDESREAKFTLMELSDDCHDCRSANMEMSAPR